MINRLKSLTAKAVRVLKRLEIIIICLIILLLFGIALLQVNDAIAPTTNPETEQQAKQQQLLKQIRYDQKSLEKIQELTNVEVDLGPGDTNHSTNPFSRN